MERRSLADSRTFFDDPTKSNERIYTVSDEKSNETSIEKVERLDLAPRPMTKELDLGDDDGYVTVKIAGNAVSLSPSEVIHQISSKIQSDEQRKGMAFIAIVQDFLKAAFGLQSVSVQMATTFYDSMVRSEKELSDFFGKRLDSLFTSGSIPGASVEPAATDTLPTCPG